MGNRLNWDKARRPGSGMEPYRGPRRSPEEAERRERYRAAGLVVFKMRYTGSCRTCGYSLSKGTSALYHPNSKTCYCLGCAV